MSRTLTQHRPPADLLVYRHPRTLVEAFGPDAHSAVAIHGPYTDGGSPAMDRADRIVVAFCAAVGLALVVMTALGWI